MNQNKRIFALGFFDGVHLGHQALLRECVRLAAEAACETAAITFESHPQSLFAQEIPPLINSLSDRKRLLAHYGMDQVYAFPVTEEVMGKPWDAFLEELMDCGAVGFVCGHDFRFGHMGRGNARLLEEFCTSRNLRCTIVPEQQLAGRRVSSTYIRSQLEAGDMQTAVKFLGHPHILTGTVMPGHQLGRRLGFPTANLWVPQGVAAPKFGVYACRARVAGQWYPAVTNVGTRPTVSGAGITVETWILDFSGDLYNREITLEFHRFLRPEEKFPNLEALQAAIRRDGEQVRAFFGEMVKNS